MAFLLLIVLTACLTILIYFKWNFQYWHKKNLPFLKPLIPFGNCPNFLLGKKNLGVELAQLYTQMKKKGWKHGGIYILTSATYIPVHLDFIKNLLQNDFHHFSDRLVNGNTKKEPLNAHILNLNGTKWRYVRNKLTPSFTAGKIKAMFDIMTECQDFLVKKMNRLNCVEMEEICMNFTMDVIGSCAFGLDCKSMENANSPFKIFGRKAIPKTTLHRLKLTIISNFPKLGEFLNFRVLDEGVHDFFINLAKEMYEYREKNEYIRDDLMQSLIEMKRQNYLTIEDVAAQAFAFFIAGFETSALLMVWALYELGKNFEMQQKVRDEIVNVLEKYNGKITYESLQEMHYLDQVMDETLRKYPPVLLVNRMCIKDYKIPNEDVVIDKGTAVVISILGVHHDEEYYPNPEKFDPERFSEENKKKMHPCAHIPFGKGPRNCVGIRLGLLQAKVGLCGLIKNFCFSVNEKTANILEVHPGTFFYSPVGGVWLNIEKCT